MSYEFKKPKRFEIHLYVSHDRFKNKSWKYDVGEDLCILGQQLMDGLDVIPGFIQDVGGRIGEVNIDYDNAEEEPQGILGKPHKADISVCLDNAAFDGGWELQLAETLILIATTIKAGHSVPEGIRDSNGNSIGSIKISP